VSVGSWGLFVQASQVEINVEVQLGSRKKVEGEKGN
jgi:hypothetical protein